MNGLRFCSTSSVVWTICCIVVCILIYPTLDMNSGHTQPWTSLHFCFRFDHNVNNRSQQLNSKNHNITALHNCMMTTAAEIRQLILTFMDSQGHTRATAAEASRLYGCSEKTVWSLIRLRKKTGLCGKADCEDKIFQKVRS